MFLVCILRCANGTFYVGHTSDLAAREKAHNDGTAAAYTAKRLEVGTTNTTPIVPPPDKRRYNPEPCAPFAAHLGSQRLRPADPRPGRSQSRSRRRRCRMVHRALEARTDNPPGPPRREPQCGEERHCQHGEGQRCRQRHGSCLTSCRHTASRSPSGLCWRKCRRSLRRLCSLVAQRYLH